MSDSTNLNRVLSCSNLPSLPSVGLKVLELTRNPSVRVDDIAKVVETDPALSAKVLKTVNSSLFGLSTPCTTIRRALGYLGLNAVKSIVLGFSLVDSAKGLGGDEGFDMNEHWRRAIYAAAGARIIAQLTKECEPDEAFTAALFQDIGSLAMYAALKNEFVQAIKPAIADHSRHADLERKSLNLTHMEAGAALAAKWRLPERYVDVIRFHHEPDTSPDSVRSLVRVVALGTFSALTLTSRTPNQELPHLLCVANNWFGKDNDKVGSMLDQIADSANELARLFEKSLGQRPDIAAIMEQANEQLTLTQMTAQREAETDSLTGLRNRKKFDDECRHLFDEAATARRGFALIMIDGDRFKSVNDTHGHHVGDAVLKELAKRIAAACADGAIPCRFGGEEFAVLAPGLSLPEAAALAERIRAAIQAPAFTFPGAAKAPAQLKVTISAGVSAFDPNSGRTHQSLAAMIEAADAALYRAKHAGRNRVCSDDASAPSAAVPAASTPAARPEPRPAAQAEPIRFPGNTQPPASAAAVTRVLLIEDDALSAKLLTMLLQKTPGLEVEWTPDGQAAIKRLAEASLNPERRPHVVISDLSLIGCDGITVLKFTRSRTTLAKIPFVVLSATVDARILQECNAAGATLVLSKTEIAGNLPKWIAKIGGELAAIGKAA